MAQRVALLVDATQVGICAGQRGMELDYALLMAHARAGWQESRAERELVVARVYLGPPSNPTEMRRRYINYVRKVGYEVRICQADPNDTAVDHEMLVDMVLLAVKDKTDVVLLVSGDGGFLRGIRAVQDQGVQVEVLGFGDATAEMIKRETRFQDLQSTSLLVSRRVGQRTKDL